MVDEIFASCRMEDRRGDFPLKPRGSRAGGAGWEKHTRSREAGRGTHNRTPPMDCLPPEAKWITAERDVCVVSWMIPTGHFSGFREKSGGCGPVVSHLHKEDRDSPGGIRQAGRFFPQGAIPCGPQETRGIREIRQVEGVPPDSIRRRGGLRRHTSQRPFPSDPVFVQPWASLQPASSSKVFKLAQSNQ